MTTRTFEVPNISCGHCVKTIEREVGELAGVQQVSAVQEDKRVTVEWDEGAQTWPVIRSLLEEINYPPSE